MSTSKSRPPVRFGYKVAFIVAAGFLGVAALPYISNAAERLAQGKPVSAEEVKKDVYLEARENEKKTQKGFEPKAVLALADGAVLIGGKGGLHDWRDNTLTPVPGFGGMEVRGLARAKDGTIYAAAKDGLWKRTGAEWKSVQEGDFHGVAAAADGTLFVAGKMGVLRSSDGTNWEPLKGTESGKKEDHDHEEKSGDKPKTPKG